MEDKLVYKKQKIIGARKTSIYYYKPENYNKYIQFNCSEGNPAGTPVHHVDLPEDVEDSFDNYPEVVNMLNFLDIAFGKKS